MRPFKLLMLGIGLAVMATAGAPLTVAAECGSSGNTEWMRPSPTPVLAYQTLAHDATHVFWSTGTTLRSIDKSDGTESWARDFVTEVVGRSLPVNRSFSSPVVAAASSAGFVYALDPAASGATSWSRSLRRATCAADSIIAPPVTQLWSESNAAFQALNTDLVIVGTAYACSTTTANRVYALNASNGTIRWVFNNTASYQVDTVRGLLLDRSRNAVYVVTRKLDPTVARNTVTAINTTNGARIWARDLGSAQAAPVMVNDRLYVANEGGVLYRLDPATGQTLWSHATTGSPQIFRDLATSTGIGGLFLADSTLTLRLIHDGGTSAAQFWANNMSGLGGLSAPAVLNASGRLYVGTDHVPHQISMCIGIDQTVTAAADHPVGQYVEVLVDTLVSNSPRLYTVRANPAELRKTCIPWGGGPSDGNGDADQDGTTDCFDGCPADPQKTLPGLCGCGVADTDADADQTPDCDDGCPADPLKTLPGICGCGVSDADGDGDQTPDCQDGCPADPQKTAPGVCGCGTPETGDTDGDGAPDCIDACPTNPPPGPVGATLQSGRQGGDALLSWTATPDGPGWNVYVGTIAGGFTYNEVCVAAALEVPTATHSALPLAGQGFYYLISVETLCGESAAGQATSGPHNAVAPCSP